MSGKGDKRRPLSVSQEQFASNWDKAFSTPRSKQMELFPETLREVKYQNMWQHSCTVEMGVMWIGKNETCNYCGAWEEDGQ